MSFDNGHAVVIGVGTYENARLTALTTAEDAEAIASALRDDAVAGYPKDHVTLLRDGGATLARIGEELDRLAADVTADDTVIVFYAGHGLLGKTGEYYLTAHDTKVVGTTIDESTGLSESTLLAKLRAIKADKVLVLLNACFSGNVDSLGLGDEPEWAGTASLGPPPSPNLAVRLLGTGSGRAVITACRADQKSWYGTNAVTTFFGQAVADGLRGRGTGAGRKFVGLFDFYEYVFETTSGNASALMAQLVQEPVLKISETVGPFPIALVPLPAGGLGVGEASDEITTTRPATAAFETVSQAEIDAVGQVRPGEDLTHKQFNIVSFSHITGGVNLEGDIVLGNQTKIVIQGSAQPASAAAASSMADLVSSIGAVIDQLETIQAQVPAEQEDASFELGEIAGELGKARDALTINKRDRALARLDASRARLGRLGPTVPAAVALSDTVGVLTQKARSAG